MNPMKLSQMFFKKCGLKTQLNKSKLHDFKGQNIFFVIPVLYIGEFDYGESENHGL